MAINAGQVTVDATSGGVLIYTATHYVKVSVSNTNATATNTVVLGASGVTTTTGHVVNGGQSITVDLAPNEALYGIRGTANSVVVSWLASS